MEIRFTKGERERFAHSPSEAVQLRADGWREEARVEQAPPVLEIDDEEEID